MKADVRANPKLHLCHGYNVDGQRRSQTYPDASAQTIAYDQGRLTHITLPNQSQIGYQDHQWMQHPGIVIPEKNWQHALSL